jgi:hypothetical protein
VAAGCNASTGECTCEPFARFNSTSRACEWFDPCWRAPCLTACRSSYGQANFTCLPCPTNFTGDARVAGTGCVRDYCGNQTCNNTRCTLNFVLAPQVPCSNCPIGFIEASSSNSTCISYNPCAIGPCLTSCVANLSSPLGFTCGSCADGYWGDGIVPPLGVGCLPRDPCAAGTCPDYSSCFPTTNRTSICQCLRGFLWHPPSSSCVDFRECDNSRTCSPWAVCTEQLGSYSCQCSAGFTLANNSRCMDETDCTRPGICPSSTCLDTPGSYSCYCTYPQRMTVLGCLNPPVFTGVTPALFPVDAAATFRISYTTGEFGNGIGAAPAGNV